MFKEVLILLGTFAPVVASANIIDPLSDEHIRVSLFRRPRSQALGRQPRSLASAPYRTVTSSGSGLCSNLATSANATECVGFDPIDNGAYYGRISIGADPVQIVNVTLDSGSADFWVYSTNGSAVQANIWVPTASKSGYDTGKNSSIGYNDGSVFFYELWNETVTFGSLTAAGVIVGAADIQENQATLSDPEYSGLLGLGLPGAAGGGPPIILQVAYQQGLIKSQLYGFYAGNETNSTDGELTVGTIDSSRYTGTLNYHNITSEKGTTNSFNVNVTKLTIEGQTMDYTNGTPLNMYVDTGTSFLTLPNNVIEALMNSTNGTSISNSLASGGYSLPCENLDKAPSITFVIDNINYTVPGNVWTHQDDSLAEAGVPCFAELYNAGDSELGGILGDTFFRQYYTVFDLANKRVGFAQSVLGNSTSSGGKRSAAAKDARPPLIRSVSIALSLLAFLAIAFPM